MIRFCSRADGDPARTGRTAEDREGGAEAVGFSESRIWHRRPAWPYFAQRMEDALEDAEVELEFRYVGELANGRIARRADAVEAASASEAVRNEPLDKDAAMRFLKWREEKKRGGGQRGRPRKGPPERTFKQAVDSVLRKIEAIERHSIAQQLKEGWSQDEEGRMIPPGWVRDPNFRPAPGEEPAG